MKGYFVVAEDDLVPGFVAEQMKMLMVQMFRSVRPSERVVLACDSAIPSVRNTEYTAGAVLAGGVERTTEHPEARPIADLVNFMRDVTGKPGVPYPRSPEEMG